MSETLCSCPSSSSDAMNVILCTVHTHWHVIVDDHPHIFDIEPACCDISCNQHAKSSLLEGVDYFGSFPLLPISVERITSKALIPERVCQLVSEIFLRNKHNHFGMFLPTKVNRLLSKPATCGLWFGTFLGLILCRFDKICQNFFKFVNLITFIANNDVLRNILVGIQNVDLANIDLDRISEKVKCKPLNLLGPCGRKKQSLPLGGVRYVAQDGSDLRFKSHIKHSVCLIQHNKFDS
mmetsp:Transcript_21761/g.52621  ORF Transcript_21761/g.52621 Transcript_21761/m.52621 type:complete len:237 (-) Transcript_21761:994-1704(-)